MVVRRLYSAYALLAFLEQETALTQQVRQQLTLPDGRFPCRRTRGRRLAALPDSLPGLIRQLPAEMRFVLGDRHYNDEECLVHTACRLSNRFLVTTKPGPYPHTDAGSPVRRVSHRLRPAAIEPFNGLFKNLFEWHGQVPVKGLPQVRLIVLGAVLV